MSGRYVLINNGKTITIICPIFSSGGRRCCDGFNDFRFNNDTIYWHFTVLLLDFWSSSMLQWTCKVGRKQTFFGSSFFCAHQPAFLLQKEKTMIYNFIINEFRQIPDLLDHRTQWHGWYRPLQSSIRPHLPLHICTSLWHDKEHLVAARQYLNVYDNIMNHSFHQIFVRVAFS